LVQNKHKSIVFLFFFLNLKEIIRLGGKTLLLKNKNSVLEILTKVYPEHDWKDYPSNAYWKQTEHQRLFLDSVAKQLGIVEYTDWYKVSTKVIVLFFHGLMYQAIKDQGGAFLLARYRNSPLSMLRAVYPELPWKPWKFFKIKHFWSSFMQGTNKKQLVTYNSR
jgi:hypothetical protein